MIDNWISAMSSVFENFIGFLGTLIQENFTLIFIVGLFALPVVRRGVRDFLISTQDWLSLFKTIEVGNVKLRLDPQQRKQLASASYEVVEKDIRAKFDKNVQTLKISQAFRKVMHEAVLPSIAQEDTPELRKQCRATIHVEDVLKTDHLYQLLDYYPTAPSAAKKRGRRTSKRFGIIGKAWRLGQTLYDPIVSTDIAEVIEKWGMTRDEADAAGKGRKSFLAVVIKNDIEEPVAILFFDAFPKEIFGKQDVRDALDERVVSACEKTGLRTALLELREKMVDEGALPIDI